MPRSTDALVLLHRDHEEVQELCKRAEHGDVGEKEQCAREISWRLTGPATGRAASRRRGMRSPPTGRETAGRLL